MFLDTSLAKGLASRYLSETFSLADEAAIRIRKAMLLYPATGMKKPGKWDEHVRQVIAAMQSTNLRCAVRGKDQKRIAALYWLSPLKKNIFSEWEEQALGLYAISGFSHERLSPELIPRFVLGKHAIARIIERTPIQNPHQCDAEELYQHASTAITREVRALIPWVNFFFGLFASAFNNQVEIPLRFLLPAETGIFLVMWERKMGVINVRTFVHDSLLSTKQNHIKSRMIAEIGEDWRDALCLQAWNVPIRADAEQIMVRSYVCYRFHPMLGEWLAMFDEDGSGVNSTLFPLFEAALGDVDNSDGFFGLMEEIGAKSTYDMCALPASHRVRFLRDLGYEFVTE